MQRSARQRHCAVAGHLRRAGDAPTEGTSRQKVKLGLLRRKELKEKDKKEDFLLVVQLGTGSELPSVPQAAIYQQPGEGCSRSSTGTSGRVEEAAPGAQAAARDSPLAFLPLRAAPGQAGIPQRAGLLQHSPAAPPWPCQLLSWSLPSPRRIFAPSWNLQQNKAQHSQELCLLLTSVLRSALRHLEEPHGWHRATAIKLKAFPEPDSPGAAPAQPDQQHWLLGTAGSPPSSHSPHLWAGSASPSPPSLPYPTSSYSQGSTGGSESGFY